MCEAIKHGKASRDALMCQNCGAVMVANYDRMKSHRKNGFSYCDKECMYQDRGRVYRTSKAYHEKINVKYAEKYGKEKWENDVCVLVWAECKHCGSQFTQRHGRACCSDECRDAVENTQYEAAKERQRLRYKKQAGVVVCAMCGESKKVEQNLSYRRFCSDRCAKRSVKLNRRHRKRTNGLHETISIQHLIEKHKGKCVECKCKVARQSGEYQDNAATIDHVIPLSKGGTHTWNNVQLMCHKCNRVKSNTVKPGTQMLLPMRN